MTSDFLVVTLKKLKEIGEINFSYIFSFNSRRRKQLAPIKSTNEIFYFFFSFTVLEIPHGFCSHGTSKLRLATFQVLNHHAYLIATMLAREALVIPSLKAPEGSSVVQRKKDKRLTWNHNICLFLALTFDIDVTVSK